MAMRLLLTIAIIKKFTVFTTDVASAFLNTPIKEEVLVQPGNNHPRSTTQSTKCSVEDDKSTLWLENVSKTMAGASEHNSTANGLQSTQE
eukprot:4289719-Amphidinium_carterae.1